LLVVAVNSVKTYRVLDGTRFAFNSLEAEIRGGDE